MIDFLGFQFDPISLIPALFGAILSLYNFYKMSRPANIFPTEIVNYGLISSSYESSFKMVLPLVFHNEGYKKGVIKDIKIGFEQNGSVTYFDTLTKVRLHELSEDIAQLADWNKFIEHGYRVQLPTYPISINADESLDVTLIANCSYDEKVIPLNSESKFVIEVFFGKDSVNKISFPFFLNEDEIPDDRLEWFSPITK